VLALLLLLSAVTATRPACATIVEDWGNNSYGQLGNGTFTNSNAPIAVTSLPGGASVVAAGSEFNLAICNGAVYGWGEDYSGQLGNGTEITNSPFAITTPIAAKVLTTGTTALATGSRHCLKTVV
jgi:alpha-tubulin suppressor-like RCC1 family protein